MSGFPRPDPQAQADNCLLIACGDEQSPHWLVYEVERDYLSVPRTFAVLTIHSAYDFHWPEDESQDTEIMVLNDTDAGLHWQISLPRLHVQCWGQLTLRDTVYGCASATEALLRVMTRC